MKCMLCDEEIIDDPQELGFLGKLYVFCKVCCDLIMVMDDSSMMEFELFGAPLIHEWNKMIDKIYINSGNKQVLYLKKRPRKPIDILGEGRNRFKKPSFWCKLSSFFSRIFKGEKE